MPGGISMGLMSAEELDVPLDFEAIRETGCLGLGTAAVTVIDDQTSMVDVLYNTCRFFAHESCGQCTPCREGTSWFYKTMKRIRRPAAAAWRTWMCCCTWPTTWASRRARRSAAWPTGRPGRSRMPSTKFRDEFEHYIRDASEPRLRDHPAPGGHLPGGSRPCRRTRRFRSRGLGSPAPVWPTAKQSPRPS